MSATVDRFLAKTKRVGACLEWQARCNDQGYGGFRLDGKWMLAHRAAFILFVGPIPEGLDVLHRCDNPPCVEPTHLWTGTDLDNARDRQEKGRGFTPPQPTSAQRARGTRHGRAVVTPEIATRVRGMAGQSHSEIARQTGVSRQTVARIIRGESYL